MAGTAGLLGRQLKQMQTDKDIPGISCGLVDDNIFEWEVMLMISDDCRFYGGGFFRARLAFPPEYPLLPPKMKFETPIFHPNGRPTHLSLALEVCANLIPTSSVRGWCSLYLHPPPPRRRQVRLRDGSRALESCSNTRDNPPQRYQFAEQPERRVSGKR